MAKEWQYIISPKEIYFTGDFRFPLKNVLQVTLDHGKKGAIKIAVGIFLIFLAFVIWGIEEASPQQGISVIAGIILLLWGLYDGKSYEVGFVILKDPKWYEKISVSVFRTHSREEAEEKLKELEEELSINGRKNVRIVHLV